MYSLQLLTCPLNPELFTSGYSSQCLRLHCCWVQSQVQDHPQATDVWSQGLCLLCMSWHFLSFLQHLEHCFIHENNSSNANKEESSCGVIHHTRRRSGCPIMHSQWKVSFRNWFFLMKILGIKWWDSTKWWTNINFKRHTRGRPSFPFISRFLWLVLNEHITVCITIKQELSFWRVLGHDD